MKNFSQVVKFIAKYRIYNLSFQKISGGSCFKTLFIDNGNSFSVILKLFGSVYLLGGSKRNRVKLIRKVENASGYHHIFEVVILDWLVISLDTYEHHSWLNVKWLNFKTSNAIHLELSKLVLTWQDYEKWYQEQLEIANDW